MAYDVFRLPFVFAKEWGIESVVPPMKLFKVFPRFGAMVLGQPIEQPEYSLAAHIVGWIYHFSNGATFGVMYLAVIGSASRRHWAWAVLFALALELGMLFTPYPRVFGIDVTTRFVLVTVGSRSLRCRTRCCRALAISTRVGILLQGCTFSLNPIGKCCS